MAAPAIAAAASKAAKPVAKAAAEVGGTVAAVRASTPKPPKVRLRGGYKSAQRPVITTMTITVGLTFLDAWLVKKEALPERRIFARLAVLGFVLALMAEITPRIGKGMSYLVLTGVVFDRSQDILRALNRGGPGTTFHGGIDPLQPPFTPDTRPVTLYTRTGPMTTEPLLPSRSRITKPQRGAWATGQSPSYRGKSYPLETA